MIKPFICRNEVHARAGDVLLEHDGRLLAMPVSTFETLRRDLKLPAIAASDVEKKRKTKKHHAATDRLIRVVMDVRTLNGATPSGMTTAAELGDYRNHTVNRCAAELWECHERGLLTREKIKTPTGRACWGYRAPANNGAAA